MVGAVFIDGASWAKQFSFVGTPRNPMRLSYRKFLKEISRRFGKLGEPADFQYRFYYTAYRDDVDLARRRPFLDTIERDGFTVSSVRAKQYPDGTTADKGVAISLALDAYRAASVESVEVLVVGTHDSDFVSLFDRVPPRVRKVVVGWKSRMARELPQAAEAVYFEDIWHRVRYGNVMVSEGVSPHDSGAIDSGQTRR